MNEFSSRIEALEHRWMRAWIARDRADMKTLSSRDLIVLFGSEKSVILDRASWLDAAESRLRCTGYRFGNVYVRKLGKTAIFASPLDLDASIDGSPVLSKAFVTSLWSRTAVRRRWQRIECILTAQGSDAEVPGAIRSMQLWR